MSEFFIRRPIVAVVISILMVIIGAITIIGLPVAQFPDIAPPEIRVQSRPRRAYRLAAAGLDTPFESCFSW